MAVFSGVLLRRPRARACSCHLNSVNLSYIVAAFMARDLEPTLTTLEPPTARPPVGAAPAATRSFASVRSILALMLREMSTRYGRTPGGYIWALLEPIGALIVMSVAFSILMRSPPLGNSFVLFYASGYLVFIIYANLAGQIQSAINFSKPLLMYPAVSWIDAILARFVLNLLTNVAVTTIVFIGILEFTPASATLDFAPMVLAVVLSAALGLGIGTLNCCLVGLFPAYGQVWNIATRPLFLVAGVIFTYEMMPEGVQDILWFTPWIHITGLFRTGVYPTYSADYVSVTLVLLWSLIPLVMGLMLLRRHYQDILNR
jgi:capsular polysaccharide transport system permease protein